MQRRVFKSQNGANSALPPTRVPLRFPRADECDLLGAWGRTYQSRIPADRAYLQAVGRAFFSFTNLEWIVVWTIVKLKSDGFGSVPQGETASRVAKALITAIAKTMPPLADSLRRSLVKFHKSYLVAISRHNKLLHAHPYTAPGGARQLSGGGHEWPIKDVDKAAKFFENAAIVGNGIFHSELVQVRP